MSPAARWRIVALLGVCATLIAGSVAPQSRVAEQLAYFLILFVLIIPIHELGHAVAGALVGFRIMSIVVGSGPPLAAFRWLGVNVQINLLPLVSRGIERLQDIGPPSRGRHRCRPGWSNR